MNKQCNAREFATPKRVIARLDIKNGRVVKGIMMEGVQPVGDPIDMCLQYYDQGIDEILLLDTVASLYQRLELPDIINELVKGIFVPVCAGGGISSCNDAERLFYAGADKICVNTSVVNDPELLRSLSREFGAQSIVLQLDARILSDQYKIFYNSGRDISEMTLPYWLSIAQDAEIGEVLLTSIEKDGTGRGPDYVLLEEVKKHVKVPVIYGGGIVNPEHASNVLNSHQVSAIALATWLHIDKADLNSVKNELASRGIVIREE